MTTEKHCKLHKGATCTVYVSMNVLHCGNFLATCNITFCSLQDGVLHVKRLQTGNSCNHMFAAILQVANCIT